MGLYLKMAAGLFLLVQVFHPASFQTTSTTPEWKVDPSWLRELNKNTVGAKNAAAEEEVDTDADGESANGYSSGIASGSMAIYNGVEENVTTTITVPPKSNTNVATKQSVTISTTKATSDPAKSNQINKTEAQEEHHNSTETPQTSTTHVGKQKPTSNSSPTTTTRTTTRTTTTTKTTKTTLALRSNTTEKSTTKPNKKDTGSTNVTGSTSTMTAPTTTTTTTTPTTPTTTMSTKSSSTTVIPATSGTSPTTTTTAAPTTPEKANNTDRDAASGSNSERGLASNKHNSRRDGAWGAVLGTAVAVVFVGLVAYIILKKKHRKGFSHRKLVEEYPAGPVHRLENGAPLDLNFGVGSSAYYNPGLQGDNIQMTNFPGRR